MATTPAQTTTPKPASTAPAVKPNLRIAHAQWAGDLKSGKGTVSTASGAVKAVPYTFAQRFENAAGTNPEELVGAAHAACFTMAFSNTLAKAGHVPKEVKTEAQVRLANLDGKWTVDLIHLKTEGTVPGIQAADFQKMAVEAKENCPISRLLKPGVQITLEARLK